MTPRASWWVTLEMYGPYHMRSGEPDLREWQEHQAELSVVFFNQVADDVGRGIGEVIASVHPEATS